MKKQPTYYPDDELLRKHLQGELSKAESEAVLKKLESDPTAMEHFKQMEKIWKLSIGLKDFQSIDLEKDWSHLKNMIPASRPEVNPELSESSKGENTAFIGSDALVGSDASVESGASSRSDRARKGPAKEVYRLKPAFRFLRTAAAVLLVALTASLIYYYTGIGDRSTTDWVTINSADSQEEILLSDGTKVFLNSESSFTYPAEFKNRKRQVTLEGEGFFEVAHDQDKPFLVAAGDEAAVEVLGTSFNLRTDPESKKVVLNVTEGRVAFYPKGKRRQAKILQKNEQADYVRGRINQRTEFDLNFLSWKTHTLEFENTPLSEVMDQMGRHYRIEFQITEPRLDTLTLTGTYIKQSMADVLQEIAIVLDVEFIEVDGKIQVN